MKIRESTICQYTNLSSFSSTNGVVGGGPGSNFNDNQRDAYSKSLINSLDNVPVRSSIPNAAMVGGKDPQPSAAFLQQE